MGKRAFAVMGTIGAFAGGLLLSSGTAAARHGTTACHLAGNWLQSTENLGSSTWTITADGKAKESGLAGATGTASLSGNVLTIDSHPSNPIYNGTYRWTLKANCSGTGTLTWTGAARPGEVDKSTVVGPPPAAVPTTTTTRPSGGAVARVGSVRGESDVIHANGVRERITSSTVLVKGDRIETGVDSDLTLAFSDGAKMTVSEMTQIEVADVLTAGSRRSVTVALKLGEVSAQVGRRHGLQTDFKVGNPGGCVVLAPGTILTPDIMDCPASVRGSKMRVFYDPAAHVEIVATLSDVATFTPGRNKKPITIPVGKEIEVTRSGVSPLAPIGKASARGGNDRAVAYRLTTSVVDHSAKPCGLTTGTFATKPAAGGWAVSVKVAGKAHGVSTWLVRGRVVKAANALAKRIAAGCA